MTIRSIEAIPVAYPEPNDHSRLRSVCLVKITSTDGVVGWGECCSYFPEASRAAKALVDGMAERLIGSGALDERALDVAKNNIAMRRFGNATDIAEAVCFLASDKASYITGLMVDVDGGYHL